MADRKARIDALYSTLAKYARPNGWPVLLGECEPPEAAGVYLFFEPGEVREGGDPRVVRVGKSEGDLRRRILHMHLDGTHRDDQHDEQGQLRSSVFRKHIGSALIKRNRIPCPSWGRKMQPDESLLRRLESRVEQRVTAALRAMSVAWVAVDDPEEIEREMIGVLSNYQQQVVIDPPSREWLGHDHWSDKVRGSGLWNIKGV